jgi:gluconolactonase
MLPKVHLRVRLSRSCSLAIALVAVGLGAAACKPEVAPGLPQQPSGAGSGAEAGSGGAPVSVGAGAGGVAAAGTGSNTGGSGGMIDAGAAGAAGNTTQPDAAVPDDAAMTPDTGTPPSQDGPCPTGVAFGDPLPPQGARTATLVRGGFDFLEGPVWLHAQGVLFFSDMHMGRGAVPPATIMRFTPPSTFVPFVAEAGSNGLALMLDGQLLACTHDLQTLSIFDAVDGTRTTLDLRYMGDRFNSPNDLTVRSDGTIYFTDPDWQLGGRPSETGMMGVYRVPPGGAPVLVDGSLNKPNGIALSPDERTLYVTSAGADLVAYPIEPDGSTGTRTVLASPGGSDGLAVDCAGNLYVTAGRVRVFDPQGAELGSINVPESPANVAFGGPERRTLYITARRGLYAIELNVPGYPY